MHAVLARLLLVGLLVLTQLPLAAHAQPGLPPGIGIRLLEAPADLAEDPRAQGYVIDHVRPSTMIEREFEVTNGEPAAFTADLYTVGARIEGQAFLPDGGRGQNLLASWVSVDPPTMQVAAGTRRNATLRIDVPADAPEGEHYAVVFAERRPDDPGGLAVSSRVGIRIYLSVGPGGAPVSDFTIDSVTASRDDDGRPTITAAVTNSGGRALDLTGSVRLTEGPGGTQAGPFDLDVAATLPPGGSGQAVLGLSPDLPDGPWLAVLTLGSGLLEQVVEVRLTFPLAGMTGVPLEVAQPSADGGVQWWTWVLPVLVLGVVGGWALTRRGPSGQPPDGPGPQVPAPPPAVAEDGEGSASLVPVAPAPRRRSAAPVPPPDLAEG